MIRIRMGMTQEQLAKVMCIPKSTISAYENDKGDIKGSVLVELSEHLDTTPNYLLGI
ncbi:helix-turn-helix domain-containing protein [Kandleria vitulina]|uniref:helix-turn-helix domain-containing protein n=1 Tax=Kandleria vitulina TaxID=1630 RepID=UPI0009BF4E2D